MKSTTYPNILLAFLMIVIFSGTLYAKDIDHSKTDQDEQKSLVISESNYNCFADINCLRYDPEVKNSGLNIRFDHRWYADRYILTGSSENERVFAEYDERGNLVKGHLVQINVPLPGKINRYLATGEHKEWKMIGNEKTVRNFDPKTTEYKVILEKEGKGKVLYFDRNANIMEPFSVS